MLRTLETYENFELELEWRLPVKGWAGVIVRHTSLMPPHQNEDGIEVRLIDEPAFGKLHGTEACGAIVGRISPADRTRYLGANRWNRLAVRCEKGRVVVTLNGGVVVDTNSQGGLAGLPSRGAIALHGVESGAELRAVRVRELR
jgi:hypothetical protein